jgi:hypothetical protein
MKKIILLSVFITSITAAFCQEFTFKIGGGYGWSGLTNTNPIAGFQPLLSNSPGDVQRVLDPANASIVNLANTTSYGNINPISQNYQDTAGSKSIVHGSYGRGWNFSVEAACRVNPYFAVGLGFTYLFGATTTASQLYGNSLSLTLGDNTTVTTSTRAYGLSMSPNITIYAAKKEWKVKPYVRVGLNIPMAGNVIDNIHINSPTALLNSTHLTSDLTVETQSKFSLGYTGAIGVEYKPIPLIGIFAEVNCTYINVAAKTSTLTNYVIDGTDLTGATKPTHADRINGTGTLPALIIGLNGNNDPLTQYSRVIEYVDNLSASNNTTDYSKQRASASSGNSGKPGYVNENQNHQEQRIYAPFSNIGLSIGISICMSKKVFKDPLGKKAKAEMIK